VNSSPKSAAVLRKKATIYDLSLLCGVSASTVSAVLNGSWRARRIKEATARQIQTVAVEQGYHVNLQARGLRSARSGLLGLLLPVHDNRFFSAMAQYFQAQVQARGQCPLVVSGGRNVDEEIQLVKQLIAHAVDGILLVAANAAEQLHDLCEAAGIPHINIDLPGQGAASVISDNYQGAYQLTTAIIQHAQNQNKESTPLLATDVCLFGGHNDHASQERIQGFIDAKQALLGDTDPQCIYQNGYSAAQTAQALTVFYAEKKALPRVLFINSSINFEGVLRFFAHYPEKQFINHVIGCYDYDPFASFLPLPVFMIRQDSAMMIARGLELLDSATNNTSSNNAIYRITPQLVAPRTALTGPLDEIEAAISVTTVRLHN